MTHGLNCIFFRFKNRHLIRQKEKNREAPDWAKLTMNNLDPDEETNKPDKPVSGCVA